MKNQEMLEKLKSNAAYLEEILPGLDLNSPGEFFFLALLLSRNIFEVILPKVPGDPYRIVYMMNDAAESFLVLENASMTGVYLENYKGEVSAGLDRRKEGWALAVHQGSDAAPVFFFSGIHMETHLYDYGLIAHFWMRGAENLRQLQYKVTVVHDKLRYLGEEACSEGEQDLASLWEFPPLSYLFYPAAPPEYTEERQEPWSVSHKAADFMERVARRAGDEQFAGLVSWYEKHPSRKIAGKLADMLKRKRHKAVPDLLTGMFEKEAMRYERRSFPEPSGSGFTSLLEKAEEEADKLRKEGLEVKVFREEPFLAVRDEVGFRVFIMVLRDGLIYRKIRIWTMNSTVKETKDTQ